MRKQRVSVNNVAPLKRIVIVVFVFATTMLELLLISLVSILHQVLAKASFDERQINGINIHPIISTEMQPVARYCEIFGLCRIVESIKRFLSVILSLPFIGIHGYTKEPLQLEEKSYYNGYGTPSSYYPVFDPLSVLASLAFLAFLLQSLAPLFDRSRSMISTAVQTQRSSNFETFDEAKPIFRELKKYDNRNEDLIAILDDEIL